MGKCQSHLYQLVIIGITRGLTSGLPRRTGQRVLLAMGRALQGTFGRIYQPPRPARLSPPVDLALDDRRCREKRAREGKPPTTGQIGHGLLQWVSNLG